ncbi:GDSL-type esterase/lipase family protein [Flammeovirga sp. SubArs3]|uniref:GDSL-type esterase/lipase family protein n=1 Tax=Flammeovirga sp. SubArs3 TaxID=2995316 RepID=UPI00248CF118|nr:GDSL-type esterase/lipase family protein [Flammeovirga sp. SubArs3]
MRILNFIILFCFSVVGFGQSVIQPNDHAIQYRGRVEFSDPLIPRFSMPSSSIKMKFSGTTLKGTFSAKNFDGNGLSYLYVILDGKASPFERNVLEIKTSKQEYTILEGLENKEHTVELVKLNEYWGMIEFHGFATDGSGALALPNRKSRMIEFYGDSNPSGWSAWNDKDQGGDGEAGGYFTYPGFTSRALEAEFTNFSAGGFGITPKMGDRNLTDYFEKIHIKTDNAVTNQWNPEENYLNTTPDVVVVNLGANDYWSGATKQMQKNGWKNFVEDQLRKVYPKAHIVLANSEGWAVGEPTDYIDEMVDQFHESGDKNISYVKFPWLWGQDHAVVGEHAGFAQVLVEHISKEMNWNILDDADYKLYNAFPMSNELLGNRSFERSILTRPDGWRAGSLQSTAKTIVESSNAKDGEAVVECYGNGGVHYAVKSQNGMQYSISVWVKGTGSSKLRYAFRSQGQAVITEETKSFEVGTDWQNISITTQKAPLDTWQIDIQLDAEDGIVQFDLIEMEEENVTSNSNIPKKKMGFQVYPNPVQHTLYIESIDSNNEYVIFNEMGQLKHQGKESFLDVSLWSSGMYFLKNPLKSETYKIIKN